LVTALADADAARIISGLNRQAGANTAGRYSETFDDLYRRLAQFPNSGALRPKLGAGVRVSLAWPCVVIYEHVEKDDVVVIMRIVHGRRKIVPRMVRRSSSSP
jgi:plasmid stabilization system protein ParE